MPSGGRRRESRDAAARAKTGEDSGRTGGRREGGRTGGRREGGSGSLFAQSESRESFGVNFGLIFAQIRDMTAALVDQPDESAAGVEVFGVKVHVLSQVADAGGQPRNLRLGGADILVVRAQFFNCGESVFGSEGSGGLGHGWKR